MTIRSLWRRGEDAITPAKNEPTRCLSCGADLTGSRTWQADRVCHACGFHYQLSAWERVATLLDPSTFREHDRGVTSIDPLSFRGQRSYRSRVIRAQRRTSLSEAALTGTGRIHGNEVAIVVLDFGFLGGSIGVAAGERIARAIERAANRGIPLISVVTTSGARVQEGLLALMQLPRIAAAFALHERQNIFHVLVVADPTTGAGYTGYVNQADIIIGEPQASLGAASRRDVESGTRGTAASDAHHTEGHLERGLIDAVVPRDRLRDVLGTLLATVHSDYRIPPAGNGDGKRERPRTVAWSQVQLSRHSGRPTARDIIRHISPVFFELRGDRARGDDPSVVAGFGTIDGESVAIIGQQRRNTGTGTPLTLTAAGFGKATRVIRLAGKFGLPIVTLVDTPGLPAGMTGEETGLAAAVTETMTTMLRTPVPTVAVIVGESASEAAMALAVADRVLMLEHAVYAAMLPEDAVRLLSGNTDERVEDVAERLRLTSRDCLRLGVVDAIVDEPKYGAHTDHAEASQLLQRRLVRELARLSPMPTSRRTQMRLQRYRATGAVRGGLLGTLERRLAHLADRLMGAWHRLRRRSPLLERWSGALEDFDIAV